MKYENIIWDWNGTLLNDVWLCIDSINRLCVSYNIPPIDEITYKELFDFPVQNYYERIGFDFNRLDFRVVGQEFIDFYNERRFECKLHSRAHEILAELKSVGVKQYVVSAREQQQLAEEVAHYGLTACFESINGISDNYAGGKAELGKSFMQREGLNATKTLFVGDTIHDLHVARLMGVDCVLIPEGHHSLQRLMSSGARIISGFAQIPLLIYANQSLGVY